MPPSTADRSCRLEVATSINANKLSISAYEPDEASSSLGLLHGRQAPISLHALLTDPSVVRAGLPRVGERSGVQMLRVRYRS